jgi:antitoxin component of MazEF toxin-antitoxin module
MPMLKTIVVSKVGGSFRMTMPGSWVKMHEIKHHTELQIMEHGAIVVFPPRIDKSLDNEKLITDIRSTLNFLKQ